MTETLKEGWDDPEGMSRRSFLEWMSALTAVLVSEGCARQPAAGIVPYAKMPERIIPGKPLFYATTIPLRGEAMGMLVESHMGRPTKIEGNELHPASLGGTDPFMQAAVLELYDPDRSRAIRKASTPSEWGEFVTALAQAMRMATESGKSVRLLTRNVLSPTLGDRLTRFLASHKLARWHRWDPVRLGAGYEGARLLFGKRLATRYDFSRADVIVSFDADFLYEAPGHLVYARQFADRRRAEAPKNEMSRLYVLESRPTLAGAMADHRLPLRPSWLPSYAAALAEALGGSPAAPNGGALSPTHRHWIAEVAKDCLAHRGRSLVIAGESMPPAVHAAVLKMNQALGNVGKTVYLHEPPEIDPVDPVSSLRELVADMNAGQVGAIVILGGNPVYDAPADLDFASALERVPFSACLSLYDHETSQRCRWHLPQAHPLESWGDHRAFDGTASLRQPLIEPLFGGVSALKVVNALLGEPHLSDYETVRSYWRSREGVARFETSWRRWLHDGVIAGTAAPTLTPAAAPGAPAIAAAAPSDLDIVFTPDMGVWDGEFANNGWLQEMPRPYTGLVWDNAALVSPTTAAKLHVGNESVVEITVGTRSVEAPVWVLPGHADDTLTLTLGYGRKTRHPTLAGGRLAFGGGGFDAYRLRPAASPWSMTGAKVRPLGRKAVLVSVRQHLSQEGRNLARGASVETFRHNPHFVEEKKFQGRVFEPTVNPDPKRYPPHPNSGESYQWGMAIDMNACIGCHACVIACQSENNIPVVGKEQSQQSRSMHWLRIDTYLPDDKKEPQAPGMYFMPVPCMHCETAPCELVCPVEATLHDREGLNEMVYNRCVGTRYCSNNCPYKVRRFNFFNYKDPRPIIQLARNPDVTVRERGVMEKCTYCVQRINVARIESEKEGRKIRDGEIVPACSGACPTRAIVFGNVADPSAKVSRLKAEPLNYSLLEDLNTKPRTTYLGKLRNPNPQLKGGD